MNFPHVEKIGCHDEAADCAARGEVVLIIKPDRATVCLKGEIQFSAFIRTTEGEVSVTQNLIFSSTKTSVLTINASTGLAQLVAAGTCSVAVAWQDKMAFANITILGTNGLCCDNHIVAMEVVIDASLSMADPLNTIYAKLDAASVLAKNFTDVIRISKDLVGLGYFNTNFYQIRDIGSTLPTDSDYASIEQTPAATILSSGLNGAIAALNEVTADQRVIVLFSDGDSRPSISQEDEKVIVETAKKFKDSGGIIIVVGIRAFGSGYDLLQKVANSGYFINLFGDGIAPVNNTATLLFELMAYFCASTIDAQFVYMYLYDTPATGLPVASQTPDPFPLKSINEPL